MNDISRCEETGPCSDENNGLTTCIFYHEDRLTYAHVDWTWKTNGHICLPDECTDEANLEKLEDFHYAILTWLERKQNNLYLTAEQIREGYLVDYSCSTSDENEKDSDEQEEEEDTDDEKNEDSDDEKNED